MVQHGKGKDVLGSVHFGARGAGEILFHVRYHFWLLPKVSSLRKSGNVLQARPYKRLEGNKGNFLWARSCEKVVETGDKNLNQFLEWSVFWFVFVFVGGKGH